jgi:hypothetical protein
MLNPRRLTSFLPVALAVLASGCGSTETASSTKATSAHATTSASANASTQTASQSTASKAPQQTSTTPAPKAFPTVQAPPSHTSTQAPTPGSKATKPRQPRSYPFPPEFQQRFIAAWTEVVKGSKSSGECIIAKFEKRTTVEEGQALAELVGLELVLRRHELSKLLAKGSPLLERAQQYAKECHHVIT